MIFSDEKKNKLRCEEVPQRELRGLDSQRSCNTNISAEENQYGSEWKDNICFITNCHITSLRLHSFNGAKSKSWTSVIYPVLSEVRNYSDARTVRLFIFIHLGLAY